MIVRSIKQKNCILTKILLFTIIKYGEKNIIHLFS